MTRRGEHDGYCDVPMIAVDFSERAQTACDGTLALSAQRWIGETLVKSRCGQ